MILNPITLPDVLAISVAIIGLMLIRWGVRGRTPWREL